LGCERRVKRLGRVVGENKVSGATDRRGEKIIGTGGAGVETEEVKWLGEKG